MTTVTEQIAELVATNAKTHRKLALKIEGLMAHTAAVERCHRTLSRFVKMGSVMVLSSQILLRIEVTKLSDVQPALEQIEEDLGVEFDKTQDTAEYRWRTFESAAAPWIRVDAELTADGEECRRVVVGYDTVPRYELKCGEDAKAPDAPMPATNADHNEEQ